MPLCGGLRLLWLWEPETILAPLCFSQKEGEVLTGKNPVGAQMKNFLSREDSRPWDRWTGSRGTVISGTPSFIFFSFFSF